MKILVVGGTADGRKLATELFELGFDVIYSIAGIVRKATVPCAVISGGFTQFGGLAAIFNRSKNYAYCRCNTSLCADNE